MNPRPAVYKTAALPLSYTGISLNSCISHSRALQRKWCAMPSSHLIQAPCAPGKVLSRKRCNPLDSHAPSARRLLYTAPLPLSDPSGMDHPHRWMLPQGTTVQAQRRTGALGRLLCGLSNSEASNGSREHRTRTFP